MITSINQLSAELQAIQDSHYQLNSYYFGEFNLAVQNRELKYPALICDYNSGNINVSNTSIQLFVIVCDKVYKDNSNLIETKSDTLQICRDIFNVMKKSHRWQNIGRVLQGNISAFVERGRDEVAGHVMNVTIEMRDSNGICDLPMDGYDFETDIVNINCSPVLVVNSNSTYVQQVNSGDSLVLPDMIVDITINGVYKESVTLITLDQ
jgi:hypothetical protein